MILLQLFKQLLCVHIQYYSLILSLFLLLIIFICRLVLTVRNSKLGKASTTTQHVFFRQSAFDLHGERIALADHHGNVFILDLSKNRYRYTHFFLHKNNLLYEYQAHFLLRKQLSFNRRNKNNARLSQGILIHEKTIRHFL